MVLAGSKPSRDSSAFHQGIAPAGWHVPEVEEWSILIDYQEEAAIFNGSYLDEGKAAYF